MSIKQPAPTTAARTVDRILIVGATGGLGSALAYHYAAPGKTLLLWGRNRERLADIAETCRRAGADVEVRSLDITDTAATIAAVDEDDEAAPITLAVIASGAGDIQPAGAVTEDAAQVARLGLLNFVAPSALAVALAGRMAARRAGTVVLIGSAAAFHALPFAAGYAGSKAGLVRFADALRLQVARHGVCITLVSPGFIDTAAARAVPGPKPFMMQPADAAARIARAAERGSRHVIMPWAFSVLRVLDRMLPLWARDRLLLSLTPRAM
jgi:short-subunit dehydrogenase